MTLHALCTSTAVGLIRTLASPAAAGVTAWRDPSEPGRIRFSRPRRLFALGRKVKVYIGDEEAGDTAFLTEIAQGEELFTSNTGLTYGLFIRVYVTDLADTILDSVVVQTIPAVGAAVVAPTAAGALPDLTLTEGVAMSADLSGDFTDGGGTLTFALAPSSAALPAGLSLSTAGTLSGTPTAAATSRNIVVRATNSASSADSAFSLAVEAAEVTEPGTDAPVSDQTASFGSLNTAGTAPYQIRADDGEPVTNVSRTGGTATGYTLTSAGVVTPSGDGGADAGTILVSCDQGTATLTLDVDPAEPVTLEDGPCFVLRDLVKDTNAVDLLSVASPEAALRCFYDHANLVRSVGRKGADPLDLADGYAAAASGAVPGMSIGSGDLVTISPSFGTELSGYLFREKVKIQAGWSGKIRDCAWLATSGVSGDLSVALDVDYDPATHIDFEDSECLAEGLTTTFGSGPVLMRPGTDADGNVAYTSMTMRRIYVQSSSGDPYKLYGISKEKRQIVEHCYGGPGGLLPGPLIGDFDTNRGYVTGEHFFSPTNGGIFRALQDLPVGYTPPAGGVSDANVAWSDPHSDALAPLVAPGGILMRCCIMAHTNDLHPGRGVVQNNSLRVSLNTRQSGDPYLPLRGVRAVGCHFLRNRIGDNWPADISAPYRDGGTTGSVPATLPFEANRMDRCWIEIKGNKDVKSTSMSFVLYSGTANTNTAVIGNRNTRTGARMTDTSAVTNTPLVLTNRVDTETEVTVTFDRAPVIYPTEGITVSGNSLIIQASLHDLIAAGFVRDASGNTYEGDIFIEQPDGGTVTPPPPAPSTRQVHGFLAQSEIVQMIQPSYQDQPAPALLDETNLRLYIQQDADSEGDDVSSPFALDVTEAEIAANNMNPAMAALSNFLAMNAPGWKFGVGDFAVGGTGFDNLVKEEGAAAKRSIEDLRSVRDLIEGEGLKVKNLIWWWYNSTAASIKTFGRDFSPGLLGQYMNGASFPMGTNHSSHTRSETIVDYCMLDLDAADGVRGRGEFTVGETKLSIISPMPFSSDLYGILDAGEELLNFSTAVDGQYMSRLTQLDRPAWDAVVDFTEQTNTQRVLNSTTENGHLIDMGGPTGQTHPDVSSILGTIQGAYILGAAILKAEGIKTLDQPRILGARRDASNLKIVRVDVSLPNGGDLSYPAEVLGDPDPVGIPHHHEIMGFELVKGGVRRPIWNVAAGRDAAYTGTITVEDTGTGTGASRKGVIRMEFANDAEIGSFLEFLRGGRTAVIEKDRDHAEALMRWFPVEYLADMDPGGDHPWFGMAVASQPDPIEIVADTGTVTPPPSGAWDVTGGTEITFNSVADVPAVVASGGTKITFTE